MRLAILIPTLISREDLFHRVSMEIFTQIAKNNTNDVVLLVCPDEGQETTGAKRNNLIQKAIENGADYISFVDDDDLIGETYIQRGLEVMNSGMDCGELWGNIYWNGKNGKPFHHSLEHDKWWEDDKFYYRCPNHLNFMRLDKVKDFKFLDQNFGEDGNWSMDIKSAGVLKTQYPIPEVIYHYFNGTPKHEVK